MIPLRFTAFILLMGMLLTGTRVLAAPAPEAAQASKEVQALIDALADSDPSARNEAAQRLKAMGAAARPALLEAAKSSDPQIRSRAGQILLEMPWHRPEDPPPVKAALADYGQQDEQKRKETIERLHALQQAGAMEAMLRLLVEEPSGEVRWTIVSYMRRLRNAPYLQRLQQLDTTPDNAPLLTLAGWAWMQHESTRARKLFKRAIDIEMQHPAPDGGELDVAFDVLIDSATGFRNYDEAADLMRSLASRGSRGQGDGPPAAVLSLFALHADHGPLKGFDKDKETYASFLGEPIILYAVGRIYERTGDAALADATYRAAFAASLASPQHHYAVGDFLADHKWNDPARAELEAAVKASGPQELETRIGAHYRLARLAKDQEDYASAAENLRLLLDAATGIRRGGEGPRRPEDDLLAEMHWRLAQAAKSKGDKAELTRQLDKVVEVGTTDMQIAMEVIPELKANQRDADAKKIFDPIVEQQRQILSEDPESAEQMNNLAWLCARTDERLQEALAHSKRAVSLAPDNYAYIDTLAECNFRVGNYKEAVELETKAHEMRPADEFIAEQLVRFRKGK